MSTQARESVEIFFWGGPIGIESVLTTKNRRIFEI